MSAEKIEINTNKSLESPNTSSIRDDEDNTDDTIGLSIPADDKQPSRLDQTGSIIIDTDQNIESAKTDNKDLIAFETNERRLLEEDMYPHLYPHLNDPDFNNKIAQKKEFSDNKYDGNIYDLEEQSEKLCNADFELAPHQLFVRNFLSFNTPYNSLLLFHGLGTGKTCSAIGVCEEMRDYMKQMGLTQRIIVVASPNVQENFQLQLFDERKLRLIDGLWNMKACTGNKYIREINPMNMKGLPKERVVAQIKRIISGYYLFMGYTEFSNYISKKSAVDDTDLPPDKIERLRVKKLKNIFNNRLIVIDEVQNIRISDDNNKKKIAINLMKLADTVDNLRLLFLSATPMYNSYKEIIWLLNLMNRNDNRFEINVKDVFSKDGSFKVDDNGVEIGKQLLMQKATGYVSFIRGENPYTFPYRVWPTLFAPDKSIKAVTEYPRQQLNGNQIVQGLEHLDLYMTDIGDMQSKGYQHIIGRLQSSSLKKSASKTGDPMAFENMNSFGYTMLTGPLEALNIVYPIEGLEEDAYDGATEHLTGKGGLRRIMNYIQTNQWGKEERYDYEYKPEVLSKYGNIFHPDNIGRYSGKIKAIIDNVQVCNGIVLIYSQYLEGGLVPIALALEEMGFSKYAASHNLLKNNPKTRGEKYIMITGDKYYSPNNIRDIKAITSEDNVNGEKIKVVLISKAGAEGLDFKNIRQVHILEPWYNTNRIEQIIGRAVRTCSHKLLPFVERNVEIYMYGTLLEDSQIEAVDLYVYRIAEVKAIQIGRVTRVLKQSAVDCILNHEQTNFTEESFNRTINIHLGNGNTVEYKVGDKPYSAMCDYMDTCSFDCDPADKSGKISLDTYDETFILLNNDRIIQRIKDLFKEQYIYKKNTLISSINVVRTYPLMQIYSALNQLIEDNNEYLVDKYGRIGYLINIGDYYMFQPAELNNNSISSYDRRKPIDFKKAKLIVKVTDEHKNKRNLESLERREDKVPERIDENNETERIDENNEIERIDENNEIERIDENNETEKKIVVNKLIGEMEAQYVMTTELQHITRGETDWYKFAGHVIKTLEQDGIDKNLLLDFIIAHQIDSLMYNEKLDLLNYLYFNTNEPTSYENKLSEYLKTKELRGNSTIGIFLQKQGKYKLVVQKTGEWREAEESNYADLAIAIRDLIGNVTPRLNDIIGFINNFKGGTLVFKTKDLTVKRSKGARCDQSGKKGNNGVLKTLNKILGTSKYSSDNTKGIYAMQLCVLEELTLRYYNHINHDNKIWFIGPEIASLLSIESYQK